MTIQNPSLKNGFAEVTNGLLEYRSAISKKLEEVNAAPGSIGKLLDDAGLIKLLECWSEGIDLVLESIVTMSTSLEDMETYYIEFGVYQADGKEG